MPTNRKIYMFAGQNDANMTGLPAVAEVDSRGRVQIPLPIRRALGIKPGDFVNLEISKLSEEMIIAKSERENPPEALTLALA